MYNLAKLVNYNYNRYMSSMLSAIASYQGINNFYNISTADTPEIAPLRETVPSDTNTLPQDDEAAFASISPEAMALYNAEQQFGTGEDAQSEGEQLTQQEQQEVSELKTTDAQVKAHEHAHLAAAAGLKTSGPNYEYETGPDGKKYAVAGDVNISYQASSDPEVNLRNAQQLRAAALAPADPSAQDRKVAAQAEREIAQARQEILEEQNNAEEDDTNSNTTASDNNPSSL